jgi:hypothetical protein
MAKQPKNTDPIEQEVQKTEAGMKEIFGTKPNESQLEKMVDSWGQRRKPKPKK